MNPGVADDLRLALAWQKYNRADTFYPDNGPLRRELYPKHIAFFAAGATFRERGCVAANRVGKSEGIGAYEVTCHVTGNYPKWWNGHRFSKPVQWWVAGDTNQTTRDILQAKLLGRIAAVPGDKGAQGLGTGMIPKTAIAHTRPKAGIPNAIETAWIKHVSGGYSNIVFKSFEQGRVAFQGTEQDGVWLDEEPPLEIYNECLIRTMKTGNFAGGLMLSTWTPLSGWSDVVAQFLNEEEREKANRYVTQVGWDDVPHLSEAEKTDMVSKIPEYQRDARMKGIPQLGSGAIYPMAESSIVVDPFEIPKHWWRSYGLDVGWNRTAAIWAAEDRDSGKVYLYDEHYVAHADPGENTRAIKARGPWINGVIDPASRGRSQIDGGQLIQIYTDLGLKLSFAVNSRESGLYACWERMTGDKLKVFRSLGNFWREFRMYRRDEKGQVVKKDDHLMDAMRYNIMDGGKVALQTPSASAPGKPQYRSVRNYEGGWMG